MKVYQGTDRRNKSNLVYSDCTNFNEAVDVHRAIKNKDIVVAADGDLLVAPGTSLAPIGPTLDWHSWLPFCAEEYKISRDPKDYVLLPTIICPSDLPNRNGVGFPLQELIKWDAENHRQVYKGWIGCPTFSEHANTDNTQARGVVIDAVIRRMNGVKGNVYKVLGLCAFDRTKYPEVAARLLSRKTTTVSMGCYVGTYSCSLCHQPAGGCNHINLRRQKDFYIDNVSGKLVYRRCHGISPFEVSEVQTPAWSVAESPYTIDLSNSTAYR